ncbi:phosphoadenylyl-sulfate reductase [Lysinibacillus fusiformis]|uniref:phosphoadenylyl-sulfate reductase n=1 Tax=Lysinibacillus fusiformis TaxID=28031 RepID=UPI0011BB94EF|nr:phosphoadenylyl-sulfate reductase [Lysinibacillus fusiformis]KAB0444570.1 phosphoadenosine phosphosulfate reductase [Lysinibacillus fusiformis]MCE4045052.1 phosphoadenylyl-sulfate reductase [Lysinibacillus fusiformis]MCT6817152.1 phosphoadenylyl-sulfate reductase [Lysinibacillus fusiformis]MCT6929531.1 phosphoadenylyl-sulfate reductase [Lysinibacillus fusiformis]MCT6933926.1 phosphoadenylyl-sulfate reductase [Lysinibacillus fusiformis]
MLTHANWQEPNINFQVDETYKGALEVLQWSYQEYGNEIVYACSFGIEGIVLIDLISKVKPDATIVFLDTDVHFKETYETIQRVKEKYPLLNIVMKKPALTLEQQAAQYGDELWKSDPNQCCAIRKIKPLHEALSGTKAWISGLRREQSPSRQQTNFLNRDNKFKSIKVCPLIHWTWKDVWRYVSKHNLPYNPLHDQGYPSIGCEHCTKPAFTMDDLRSGRWQGSGKTECGLHE